MVQVQRLGALGFAVMITIFSVGMEAQAGDPATLIQEKLVSQIKLTKPTADRSILSQPVMFCCCIRTG